MRTACGSGGVMASNLFATGFCPSADLKRDLQRFVKCPPSQISALVELILAECRFAQRLSEKATANIAEKLHLEGTSILGAWALGLFLIRAKREYGDSPASVARDIAKETGLNEADSALLQSFAKRLTQDAEIIEEKQCIRYSTTGTIPIVTDISHVCDLRLATEGADFNPWYDPIEQYVPRYRGLVPVAVFRIRLDRSGSKEFVFQLNEQNLESLITAFQQAAADIAEVRERFSELSLLAPPQDREGERRKE